tara:strand:- start:3012 stop:3410 length:399 start_codon:yes stop_codon:yes gene_type:complete
MKLINLLPLKESDHETLSIGYFRKFQEAHEIAPLFDYLGTKDDIMVYTADLANFGDLTFMVKKAQIVAKVTKKEALFGVVYVCCGAEVHTSPICKIKRKEQEGGTSFKLIQYDPEDKKNFSKDLINFKKFIQ